MTAEPVQPPSGTQPPPTRTGPPEVHVRHAFWKYPIIAAALLVAIVVVALVAGSPNWPRDDIASVAQQDPGGSILAFTQELDGTSSSWGNTGEVGTRPDQLFVIQPLKAFGPLLGSSVARAVATYAHASDRQRQAWATAYDAALGSITPESSGGGGMEGVASPDYSKIPSLSGDFGPVPTLTDASLELARGGYLEMYLTALHPGHSLHLATIWLYDEPHMLNTAVAQGLTDDQWGMVKERGFPVGPWYLILPAIIHVLFPGGTTGIGFTLWSLVFALLFFLAVPLMPGLRGLPKRLGVYRLMYRYQLPGEAVTPYPATHEAER
jgi:hypothetical protein